MILLGGIHIFPANHLTCLSTKVLGRLSPFKSCVRCCHSVVKIVQTDCQKNPHRDKGRMVWMIFVFSWTIVSSVVIKKLLFCIRQLFDNKYL